MELVRLLFGNLRDTIAPPLVQVVLVTVSILCGAIVGAEREHAEKPAGLRTLLLICLGSTIFTLMSIDSALGAVAPTRIAAQIVTGVGFLGAGAILREKGGVVGLTTAASIWVVAALGIVVGAGYALAGLALSVAIVATLGLLSRAENRLLGTCDMTSIHFVISPENGKTWLHIRSILDDFGQPSSLRLKELLDSGEQRVEIRYCRAHRHHRAFLSELAKLPQIQKVECDEDTFVSELRP